MKTFNQQVFDLETKAVNKINKLLPKTKEYYVLVDVDNGENDESEMPNHPYYGKHGFEDFAKVIGIYRHGKSIMVKSITQNYAQTVVCELREIECYGICALTDIIIEKFGK